MPRILFNEWLNESWTLFKVNAGTLIVASLLALLLSALSFGILAGPMLAGLSLMTLKIVDKRGSAEVNDLFVGFNFFLQSFLFVLVWSAISAVVGGIIFAVTCGLSAPIVTVGGMALGAALMFAIFLIVEKNLAFWPASMASFNAAKPVFFPLLGYYILASLIGSLGAVFCGIGMAVTLPLSWIMYTVAYRAFFPLEGSASEATEPAPAEATAPPVDVTPIEQVDTKPGEGE